MLGARSLSLFSWFTSDSDCRTKIHSILKSYGQWMQYSVFEQDVLPNHGKVAWSKSYIFPTRD
ncbi:MAG: CRISPR-associated endonuclease Cas2 [Coleofasciculus sp. C2-GNP5-27]